MSNEQQEKPQPDQSTKLFGLAVQIFNMSLHDLVVVPNISETKLQDLPDQEIQEECKFAELLKWLTLPRLTSAIKLKGLPVTSK